MPAQLRFEREMSRVSATVSAICAVFSVLILSTICGCNSTPESAMTSRLATLLEHNGFTLYTPFRTKAYPATVFVLSKNHIGKSTELTISDFDRTFDVDPETLFVPEGERVEFADELRGNFQFGARAALDVLTVLVSAQAAAKYAKRFVFRVGDPKIVNRITLERLNELAPDLRDAVRRELKNRSKNDELQFVYLVIETLSVGSLEVELELKSEFKAAAALKELEKAANVGVATEMRSEQSIVVRSSQPLLIGYKAISFPATLLRDEVSTLAIERLKPTSAEAFREAKSR